jgi:hypothetical protein
MAAALIQVTTPWPPDEKLDTAARLVEKFWSDPKENPWVARLVDGP